MCSYLHVSCMYHVGMCTGLLAQLAERRAEPCRAAHNSKVLGSNQTFYTKHITCLSPAIGCLKWSQCCRNVMLCTLTWSRNVILCTLTFARTVSLPIHWSCAIVRASQVWAVWPNDYHALATGLPLSLLTRQNQLHLQVQLSYKEYWQIDVISWQISCVWCSTCYCLHTVHTKSTIPRDTSWYLQIPADILCRYQICTDLSVGMM